MQTGDYDKQWTYKPSAPTLTGLQSANLSEICAMTDQLELRAGGVVHFTPH